MDDRTLARSVAVGRVLFGLLMLFVPHDLLVRFGAAASATGRREPQMLVWLARSFGVREIILGGGALVELSDPEPDGRWVTAGAMADTADAAAALLWRQELGPYGTAATLSVAIPAAAAGWKASSGLRPA